MKTKLFFIVIALLSFSAIHAQTKKELKQRFKENKSLVSQGNYEFSPDFYYNAGEDRTWQDMPETPNYLQIKGDSIFVELNYTSEKRKEVIKYKGTYYSQKFIEEKEKFKVKLNTSQDVLSSISLFLVIPKEGYISLILQTVRPEVLAIKYKGRLRKL